jgi:protein TonB
VVYADDDPAIERKPEAIIRVPPSYPELAYTVGVDGVVQIKVLVGADGKMKDTRVVKSIQLLDQAALDAVRQWEFRPGEVAGRPAAMWMTVPVRFTLH